MAVVYKIAVLFISVLIILCEVTSLNSIKSFNADEVYDEPATPELKNGSLSKYYQSSLMGSESENVVNYNKQLLDRAVPIVAIANVGGAIVGFASAVIGIYWFAQSTATAPKHTVDDVMATLDTEFRSIGNQLSDVLQGIGQLQLASYKDVEIAIRRVLTQMRQNEFHGTNADASNLYTKLDMFLDGMLGNLVVMPNIIEAVKTKANCNYNSIFNQMNKIINLFNIGVIGLSYSYKKLNLDETVGEERVNVLGKKRDTVFSRVTAIEWECVDPKVINPLVEKMLSGMQSWKECDVAKEVDKHFQKTYGNMIWSWYAVWKFDPSARYNSVSYKLWGGGYGGVQSMAENGGWKVYWTAQKKPHDWDQQGWLKVDSNIVRNAIDPDAKWGGCVAANMMWRSALFFAQSGRRAYNLLVLCNSPQHACAAGNNVYYERFKGKWRIDVVMN